MNNIADDNRIIRILDENEVPEDGGVYEVLDDGSIAELSMNVLETEEVYVADCCNRGWVEDVTRFYFYTLREMHEAGLKPFMCYDEALAKEWGYESVEDIKIQMCPLCERAILLHKGDSK